MNVSGVECDSHTGLDKGLSLNDRIGIDPGFAGAFIESPSHSTTWGTDNHEGDCLCAPKLQRATDAGILSTQVL